MRSANVLDLVGLPAKSEEEGAAAARPSPGEGEEVVVVEEAWSVIRERLDLRSRVLFALFPLFLVGLVDSRDCADVFTDSFWRFTCSNGW